MASRTRILNENTGFGFPFNGKLSVSNVQYSDLLGKKIEGSMKQRRPLQELSCKNMENNLGSCKALDVAVHKTAKLPVVSDKPNQEKVKKKGGRKALGDLTNSSKLLQRGVSSQKNSSLKLPSVAEKVMVPEEEGCLHDHRQCTAEARSSSMDINYLLETVGFQKGCSTPVVNPKLPPSTTSKLESPVRFEFDCYDGALSPTALPQLESPARDLNGDVNMLQLGLEWDSLDFSGFKMESPSK